MKKGVLFFIVFLISVLTCAAQWKGTYFTDSYTDEKQPMIEYNNKTAYWSVSYLDNSLFFIFLHSPSDNFDLWWDSQINNNGWISYNSDIDLNFIGRDPKEFNYNGNIENYDKDGLFFRFIIDDSDGEILRLLKNNNKLNIRFYNIVKERTMVYNIPLTGVSAQCKKVGL